MRDLYKALGSFEAAFEATYGLSLNESMILCALREFGKPTTPTDLSKRVEIRTSHLSKLLRSLEDKKLISRSLGNEDRRQMYFALTDAGVHRLGQLDMEKVEVPELLRPLFP